MKSLPPYLMTSDQGSFAQKTISERKPLIIDTILTECDFSSEIQEKLHNFKNELEHEFIHPLQEITDDRAIWDQDIRPWLGKKWLELPWFFAETYFYRRILEITSYFQTGSTKGADPFGLSKEKELVNSLSEFVENDLPQSSLSGISVFRHFIYRSLWGNRADLSNLEVFETSMDDQPELIIINHTKEAFAFLSVEPRKIAFFVDNAGKELLYDIALMDYLIQSGLARSLTCYLKNQPFFVSDAMPKDFFRALGLLSTVESAAGKDLSKRMMGYLDRGAIKIEAPLFLTTSRMFWDMPKDLIAQLKTNDLIVLKGDVNYRRLFGDCHWDPLTPVKEAAGYFPTNFLSLRTLKAEIIHGLNQTTYDDLRNHAEPDWMVNGKRGTIIFHQTQ